MTWGLRGHWPSRTGSEHLVGQQDGHAHTWVDALDNSFGAAIITAELDGTITGWNRGAELVYGYGAAEMLGRSYTLLEPPDRVGEIATLLSRAGRGEAVGLLQTEQLCKDGHRAEVNVSISPLLDAEGEITGVVNIGHDVSCQHDMVRHSEQRLRALVEHAADLIVVVDGDGSLRYANPAARALFQFDPGSGQGPGLLELTQEEDREKVAAVITRVGQMPGGRYDISFRLCVGDGKWRYLQAVVSKLSADVDSGEVVINAVDATDRRLADSWFRQVLTTAEEGIWTVDTQGITTFANQRMSEILDRPVKELVGTWALGYVEKEGLPELLKELERNFTSGVRLPIDTHLIKPDGSSVWVRMATSPLRDSNGEITGGLVLVTDLSAQQIAREELTLREAWLDAIVHNAFDLVVAVSFEGRITFATPSTYEILGMDESELVLGTHLLDYVHPEDLRTAAAAFGGAVQSTNTKDSFECRVRRGDGTYMWFEFTATNLLGESAIDSVIIHGRDVTERIEATDQLERNEAWLEAILHQAFDIVIAMSADGALTFVTPGVESFIGLPRETLIGIDVMELVHPEDRAKTSATLANIMRAPGSSETVELRVNGSDGRSIWIEAIVTNLLLDPVVERIIINARDITDRHLAEAKIAYHAMHDSLTGLPNRYLLGDRLDHAMARREQCDNNLAVVFIDLDHFKILNDSSGHTIGDSALKGVASRLQKVCRAGDTVARFGGDEFVLVSESVGSPEEARELGERILQEVFARPFHVAHGPVHIAASIGVALGECDMSPDRLLADADTAMYRAKARGRNRVEVFDASMRAEVTSRLQTVEALRGAVDEGDLVVHYQPIVSLPDQIIVGAEALVRLHHPVLGILSPNDFIPLAEATGLIDSIGTHVFELACAELLRHQTKNPDSPFSMSINVSPVQLRSSQVMELPRIARRLGVEPANIVLEITESTLLGDDEHMPEAIAALRASGFRIAVDDFGTGYSSLGHLKRLAVDVVKIDQLFTAGVGTSREDTAIVAAILTMAKALDLSVVAEGVETTGQADALTEMQCPQVQGYLFSRPVSSKDFDTLVDNQFLTV